MLAYDHCYLLGALFNLLLWLGCFLVRRDLRGEMLVMNGVPLLIGLPQEYWLWTRDWWHPPNLTGTRIGFEDAMYAVGTGGSLAALYTIVTGRRLVPGPGPGPVTALLPLVLNATLPFTLVLVCGTHSFVATTVGTCVALSVVLWRRPDLALPALGSAVLGLSTAFACFWLIESQVPGFVAAIWDLPRLSGVMVAGVPIEDLAWYGYTAALFGIYFKYATGSRFARRRVRRAGCRQRPRRASHAHSAKGASTP